jgi:outer membrane immunogenic protein
MNKLLIVAAIVGLGAGSASAADLPARPYTKAPPVVVPVAYNWTGWYVGGNAGFAWTKSTDTLTSANPAGNGFVTGGEIATSLPLDPKGFIGGGQFGYNWQSSSMWVVGFETDIQWAKLNTTAAMPGPNDFTRIVTANEKLDWFGTVRGRIGVTPTDRVLLYVTGGLAYGHASLTTALTRPGSPPPAPPDGCGGFNNCQSGSVTDTKIGWTVGGGLEWALVNNWSLKGEYLYYDLGSLSHVMTDPSFPAIFNARADLKGSIARAGLNYHFGGPVVARY